MSSKPTLLCYDGSEDSRRALASVADLLATNGAALHEFQPKWAVLPTTKRQTGQLLGGLLAGSSPLSTAYILTPRRDATQMTVYAKDREGENVQRLVIRTLAVSTLTAAALSTANAAI